MYKIGLVILSTSFLLLIACGSSKNAATKDPVYDTIQVKYAKYMDVEPAAITNLRLYRFVNEWVGTKYLLGGTTKRGIDCSAFVGKLLLDVYNVDMPRTAIQQYVTKKIVRFYAIESLSEGDIIFFKTTDEGAEISHVGLYLRNNWFVNAQKGSGITIANLSKPYWKQRFAAGGKVKLM